MDGFQIRKVHETVEQRVLTAAFIKLHLQLENFKYEPTRKVQIQAFGGHTKAIIVQLHQGLLIG